MSVHNAVNTFLILRSVHNSVNTFLTLMSVHNSVNTFLALTSVNNSVNTFLALTSVNNSVNTFLTLTSVHNSVNTFLTLTSVHNSVNIFLTLTSVNNSVNTFLTLISVHNAVNTFLTLTSVHNADQIYSWNWPQCFTSSNQHMLNVGCLYSVHSLQYIWPISPAPFVFKVIGVIIKSALCGYCNVHLVNTFRNWIIWVKTWGKKGYIYKDFFFSWWTAQHNNK